MTHCYNNLSKCYIFQVHQFRHQRSFFLPPHFYRHIKISFLMIPKSTFRPNSSSKLFITNEKRRLKNHRSPLHSFQNLLLKNVRPIYLFPFHQFPMYRIVWINHISYIHKGDTKPFPKLPAVSRRLTRTYALLINSSTCSKFSLLRLLSPLCISLRYADGDIFFICRNALVNTNGS